MDDGRDGVEEGEGAFARLGSDRVGQARAGQRAGGDNRRMVGQGIDALANDSDGGVLVDGAGDFGGEGFAVDGERRSGRDAVLVGGAHDQRAEIAHFLVEQTDGIVLGIVRAEAVRADHLGQAGRSRAPESCRRPRAFR